MIAFPKLLKNKLIMIYLFKEKIKHALVNYL